MGSLSLVKPNMHLVDVDTRKMMFHVPTSSLFELDGLSREMIDLFTEQERVTAQMIRERFSGRYAPHDVMDTIEELKSLRVLSDGGVVQINHEPQQVKNFPLTTIVLNTNTGCNLSCTYCYKEDLDKPSAGKKMTFETAIQSIEMMLDESPDEDLYNVVFFGGEPLSNLPLIKSVVEWCEREIPARGKRVEFTYEPKLENQLRTIQPANEAANSIAYDRRLGLPISLTGPSGTQVLTYTLSGLPRTGTWTVDGKEHVTTWHHTLGGLLKGFADADEVQHERDYDSCGRLSKLTTDGITRDITYDEFDRPGSFTDVDTTSGNRLVQTLTYDALGREHTRTFDISVKGCGTVCCPKWWIKQAFKSAAVTTISTGEVLIGVLQIVLASSYSAAPSTVNSHSFRRAALRCTTNTSLSSPCCTDTNPAFTICSFKPRTVNVSKALAGKAIMRQSTRNGRWWLCVAVIIWPLPLSVPVCESS